MTFQSTFHKIIIAILIILSILFFALAIRFTTSYFLEFSPDKTLKPSTLQQINILQFSLLISSTILLALVLPTLYFNKPIKFFINKHKKSIQNTSLLIIVLLIIFIPLELSLRIIFNEQTLGAGFGPGSLNFNQKYVHINEDKMRDTSFQIQKPENTIRIAAIGDSFTFGSGIKEINNTYPKQLEAKLNQQSNTNYEVLNFGIPGKNTEAELQILESKALKYNPDIVTIGYVLNDFKNVDDSIQVSQSHVTIIPKAGFWLRNFFYSYAFLELQTNRVLENLNLKDTKTEIILTEFSSEKNKEFNSKLFAQLSQFSKENDFQVVIIMFPSIAEFNNYQFHEIHNFVKQTSQENNFTYIEILDVYKNFPEDELIVSKYDRHPNEQGHEIAASYILENLINNQVIK